MREISPARVFSGGCAHSPGTGGQTAHSAAEGPPTPRSMIVPSFARRHYLHPERPGNLYQPVDPEARLLPERASPASSFPPAQAPAGTPGSQMTVGENLRSLYREAQFRPGLLAVFVNPFYFARGGLYRHIRDLAPEVRGRTLDVGCGRKPYESLFPASE